MYCCHKSRCRLRKSRLLIKINTPHKTSNFPGHYGVMSSISTKGLSFAMNSGKAKCIPAANAPSGHTTTPRQFGVNIHFVCVNTCYKWVLGLGYTPRQSFLYFTLQSSALRLQNWLLKLVSKGATESPALVTRGPLPSPPVHPPPPHSRPVLGPRGVGYPSMLVSVTMPLKKTGLHIV